MRFILKNTPPPVIRTLRNTAGAGWTSVHGDQKSEMRKALHAEQRGLCAYCMRKLPAASRTTVEHWKPRSAPTTDPFEWSDLLAVCEGKGKAHTCDRRRGDSPLTLHPARRVPDVEAIVSFRLDGRLVVQDGTYEHDARTLLGLDDLLLTRSRKQAIDAVLQFLGSKPTQTKLRAALSRFTKPEGDLPPFPTAIIPLLERAIRKAQDRGQRLSKRPSN